MIEQLISPTVPQLLPTDTGEKAIDVMEESNMEQLPLVEDEKYIALVRESDLMDWEAPENELKTSEFLSYRPAVLAASHPYEAMRLAHQQNLDVIPVVDNEGNYLGAITRNELLNYITEKSGIDNPGGIIVLEIEPRNYSLYEIARVCESEEVLLISTQLYSNKVTGMLEVTLKTNRTNLGGVVSSLERYNFKVKEVYGDNGQDEGMIDRFNLLMNYLNM